MKRLTRMVRYLFFIIMGLAFVSCSPKHIPQPFSPLDLSSQVKSGEYQKKVDAFMVIFDASSSMSNSYNEERKFDQGKMVAHNLNQTIPPLDIQSGIRAFGPSIYSLRKGSPPLYEMTDYSRQGFAEAMAKLTINGGVTPLPQAFDRASTDISNTKGSIAAILISDAEDVGSASVDAARSMKDVYGDRLCIYPILIGNSPGSREIMNEIAAVGECGFATDYNTLNSPDGMATFVKKVFIQEGSVRDGDGDGDGVLDSVDHCPGTPAGVKVDQEGCPLPITKTQVIELQVEFDFDKSLVRSKYHQELENFANFMQSFPNLTVTLEGHTDSVGSKDYNVKLSQQRAERVKKYLEVYFEIAPSRINIVGYGLAKPIASNATDSGRQQNRRVWAILSNK